MEPISITAVILKATASTALRVVTDATDVTDQERCPVCGTTPNVKCCEYGRDH